MQKNSEHIQKIKKIKVRLKEPQRLYINTPFIKLDAAMKLCGEAPTGGIAKMLIEDGLVKVNSEPCSSRGKKLYPGDRFQYNNLLFEVALKDAGQ